MDYNTNGLSSTGLLRPTDSSSAIRRNYNYFLSSPEALKSPFFGQIFLRRRQNFLKKRPKKQFLEIIDQKIAFFFGAHSPSKLVYIGAKGAFIQF